MSIKVYGIYENIPLGLTLLLVVSLWQFMEKGCQIGSMPISLFWGKKGNLFFAVQHFLAVLSDHHLSRLLQH